MAIMGFGGGAMIGSPLATLLINTFKTSESAGVWQTLAVMGGLYILAMACGAFGYRVPPAGWQPEGWTNPAAKSAMITSGHVHLDRRTGRRNSGCSGHPLPQRLGGHRRARPGLAHAPGDLRRGADWTASLGFGQLDAGQRTQIAAVAAGFVGLLSLFNILGRFFWASMSDRIGGR